MGTPPFVSILSQLRCWEQRLPKDFRLSLFLVSILSQLRCWEQLEVLHIRKCDAMFQSSPSLGAGSNCLFGCLIIPIIVVSILSQLRCWEQPYLLKLGRIGCKVSILSQLRCWEQLSLTGTVIGFMRFQSSPSLGAGSNDFSSGHFFIFQGFNPLPA